MIDFLFFTKDELSPTHTDSNHVGVSGYIGRLLSKTPDCPAKSHN